MPRLYAIDELGYFEGVSPLGDVLWTHELEYACQFPDSPWDLTSQDRALSDAAFEYSREIGLPLRSTSLKWEQLQASPAPEREAIGWIGRDFVARFSDLVWAGAVLHYPPRTKKSQPPAASTYGPPPRRRWANPR